MNPAGAVVSSLLFLLFWLWMMGGMVVGYVIFLVAAWRGMRAHERVSRALEEISRRLPPPPPPPETASGQAADR